MQTTADPALIRDAERLVVPGQGSFRDGAVAAAGAVGAAVLNFLERGRPYLGICLGMQLLFEKSEEAPGAQGFGVLKGEVVRFPPPVEAGHPGARLKVPHMGWNQVRSAHPYIDDQSWYYFVHSYYCVPADKSLVVGETEYGLPLCTAVARGPIFACQFHPEKSHRAGRKLLRTFLEVPCS